MDSLKYLTTPSSDHQKKKMLICPLLPNHQLVTSTQLNLRRTKMNAQKMGIGCVFLSLEINNYIPVKLLFRLFPPLHPLKRGETLHYYDLNKNKI